MYSWPQFARLLNMKSPCWRRSTNELEDNPFVHINYVNPSGVLIETSEVKEEATLAIHFKNALSDFDQHQVEDGR